MKQFLTVVLLTLRVLCCCTTWAIASPADELENHIRQAQESQRRGDYQEAATHYREIVKLRPDLAEAHANLGLMLHLMGEESDAARSFEAALRLNPRLAAPNLFLGMSMLKGGKPAEALVYLERAHRLNPADVQPLLALGQAHSALRNFDRSRQWYQRATEADLSRGEAWYGLGVAYLALAREGAGRLAEFGKEDYHSRLLVAESLEERGWYHDAADAYRKLEQEFPEKPGLLTALGFCTLLEGKDADPSAVADVFKRELSARPGYLPAQLGLARVALEMGETAGAWDHVRVVWKSDSAFLTSNLPRLWAGMSNAGLAGLDQLLRQNPATEEDSALLSALTQALKQQRAQAGGGQLGGTDEAASRSSSPPSAHVGPSAKELFSQGRYTQCAQKLNARMPQLLMKELELLAECSYIRGDYRTAYEVSMRMMKAQPGTTQGVFWQVRTASKLAVAALAKAGEVEPNSPRMHYLLGESHRENENFAEAERAYLKALELQPSLLAARLGLASIYMAGSEYEKARGQLEAALKQDRSDPEAALMMGDVLVSLRRYEEAMPHLEAAVKSRVVNTAHAHALRSKVLVAQGKPAEALNELQQALPADPDGSYHYQLARIYRALGDQKASASALEKSERIRAESRGRRRRAPVRSLAVEEAETDEKPPSN